jgi:hypothetical protein
VRSSSSSLGPGPAWLEMSAKSLIIRLTLIAA